MRSHFSHWAKTTILSSLSVVYFNVPTVLAVEDSDTVHSGPSDRIVITGTRTPKLLSNSPVSVDVIDGDTVKLLTQGTLTDAFNFVPGLVLDRNDKDGFNVQMQGFDGDNVLVLLNGQPLISPTGAAVDLDQISAHDIAQIEVIKGAASVMYGSAAMGGVINIITHQTNEDEYKINYETGRYIGNEIEGDGQSHLLRLNASQQWGDWRHQVNVLRKLSPGFDYDDDHNHTPAGRIDKNVFNWASQYKVSGVETTIKYQFLEENKRKATGVIAGQTQALIYRSDVKSYAFDIHIGTSPFNTTTHEYSPSSWQLDARSMQHKETSGSATKRDVNIGLYRLNGQAVWSLSDSLEIVSGAVIHKDTLEQINTQSQIVEVPADSRGSVEGFTQVNWQYADLQFLAGARVQNDSTFGEHSALRMSSMLNVESGTDKFQLRLGLGQGYRVPTLKELNFEFDHSTLGYKVYGNQDLKPEEALSLNTTLTWFGSRKTILGAAELSTELNLYRNNAKNLITPFHDSALSLAEKLDISVYGNVEHAVMRGVDFSAEVDLAHLYGQFNYSYVDARDGQHDRIPGRPYHQVKANLGYRNINHEIDALLLFIYQKDTAYSADEFSQGEFDNAWLTVDFKVSQQLTPALSWRLGVNNIFDEHKSLSAQSNGLFDARPRSSRFVSFGLGYQF